MAKLSLNIDTFSSEALSVDDQGEIDIDDLEDLGNNDLMENIDPIENHINNETTKPAAIANSSINYEFGSKEIIF